MTRPDIFKEVVIGLRDLPDFDEPDLTLARLLLLVAVCLVFYLAVGFAVVALWSAR